MDDWKLWFIQLSGWPVFLSLVAVIWVAAVGFSILATRLSTNRSILWNSALAVVTLAALAVTLLGLFAWASRW